MLDPRTIIRIMGGDITGSNSVLVPGPGHSGADRSLSIKIDRTEPQRFKAHSFAGDDWQTCRDYISAALGVVCSVWRPVSRPQHQVPAAPSKFALQLWSESISACGTIVET